MALAANLTARFLRGPVASFFPPAFGGPARISQFRQGALRRPPHPESRPSRTDCRASADGQVFETLIGGRAFSIGANAPSPSSPCPVNCRASPGCPLANHEHDRVRDEFNFSLGVLPKSLCFFCSHVFAALKTATGSIPTLHYSGDPAIAHAGCGPLPPPPSVKPTERPFKSTGVTNVVISPSRPSRRRSWG